MLASSVHRSKFIRIEKPAMSNPHRISLFTLTIFRRGGGLIACGFLTIALVLSVVGPALADSNQLATSTLTAIAANQRVVIDSVLPNPTEGPERVELYNTSEAVSKVFIPVVTNGSSASATLAQGSLTQPVAVLTTDMDGWQLGNEDGSWFTFPDETPPVPYGARIVIYFDGKGPVGNDYDFSDNLAVLHTPPGLAEVFNDLQGQAALYAGSTRNDETFRSRLAWRIANE